MDSTLIIYGPTLASLLYDLSQYDRDLFGLFFGRKISQKNVSVSDKSEKTTTFSTTNVIQSYYCFVFDYDQFIDKQGTLNTKLLADLIQKRSISNSQEVIGLWRYRRNSPLRPSVLELHIYRQLNLFLSKLSSKPSQYYFALFTSESLSNNSTESIDYKVMSIDFELEKYEAIELQISNLKNTSTDEFKEFQSFSSLQQKLFQNMTVENIPPLFIQNVENSFHKSLKNINSVINEISQKSRELVNLEKQIQKLKKK
ncbi:abraxas family member [Anaeramoeba flamelloides]|uniref:Abraxas family member n=1 Tax=Anaeramoeba flamelloides TaxID=1746091 RepID=A0ABQ8XY35_9EUKA|nr:abraxas family member [Anaeramoeba flamelloides]